ncbi:hypothetical protein EVA_16544 [gut metagenome]|uniref:Uncharacterized protein n=1 Tax=gut metagenome TaxID=749906 RepID=J9G781_9ZZZZ
MTICSGFFKTSGHADNNAAKLWLSIEESTIGIHRTRLVFF